MKVNINEVKPLLEDLSRKIGQGASYSWQAILREQYVEAWMGVFWAVVGLILIGIAIWSIKKCFKTTEEGYALFAVFAGGLGIPSFLLGLTEAIHHFANPEYQALRDLMRLLTGQ